ncbi:hypothetical protein QBC40DRAFT_292710 [Triangularia verruculosa]|uniref:F-box domain-containing protein n=1 Tax=Triangularia verruculosa TaxID=2587418 RepID=A0AAN6XQ40_9PEZI|nr:hypothetical protein QBC40DRAFT_292710 [Triangularia verruculosa]
MAPKTRLQDGLGKSVSHKQGRHQLASGGVPYLSTKLSPELVILIATFTSICDHAALVRTCRYLFNTLNDELWTSDANGLNIAVFWAIEAACLRTLQRTHERYHAPLNRRWLSPHPRCQMFWTKESFGTKVKHRFLWCRHKDKTWPKPKGDKRNPYHEEKYQALQPIVPSSIKGVVEKQKWFSSLNRGTILDYVSPPTEITGQPDGRALNITRFSWTPSTLLNLQIIQPCRHAREVQRYLVDKLRDEGIPMRAPNSQIRVPSQNFVSAFCVCPRQRSCLEALGHPDCGENRKGQGRGPNTRICIHPGGLESRHCAHNSHLRASVTL